MPSPEVTEAKLPAHAVQRPGDDRGFAVFAAIWFGQVVSTLGSGMTAFALGVEIFRDTGSVTRFALIALAVGLPNLILGPVIGVLADRADRRLILILANVGSALATLILVLLVRAGQTAHWPIYLVIAASAACAAFVFPTFAAATTLLVGKQHFGRASGMNQMGNALAQIGAPLLGALLVGPIGIEGVALIDVASFLFAVITLFFVRLAAPQPSTEDDDRARGWQHQAASGWSFIRDRPGLLRLLGLFAALNFSVGMVQVLITPMVLSFASVRMLGMVLAIASSGMLVGGILMSVWGGGKRHMPLILLGALGQGLVLLLGGLEPSATLIATAAFLFLFLFPIQIGSAQAIWLAKVPPDLQGRVFATRRMIAFSTLPLAQALAGPLADGLFEPLLAPGGVLAGSAGRIIGVGPGRGMALMLILLGAGIVSTVLAGWRSPALRNLETDVPDAVPGDAAQTAPEAPRAESMAGAGGALTPASRWALATFLLITLAASLATRRAPPPRGLDAPAEAVSAARAFAHVEALSQRPHPIGSAEHERVRDHLVQVLEELGLSVEVQRATSVARHLGMIQVATVENVIARHRGSGMPGSVLLVAHYDTVPVAPGAADNGAAVAALLETARALAAGPRRARDIVFLLTDAEETGLHGARAFIREHPLARDVAVVINLDARGSGGPVYLFQTGARNGTVIRGFARGAARPFGHALLGHLFRLLPNDTDFSVFLDTGYTGLNLAFMDGLSHYHSARDRPADLSLSSLQHQADLAYGLARTFAAAETLAPATSERAYLSVLGRFVVHYPPALALGSGVAVALLLLLVLARGLARGRLRAFPLWQGFLALFGQWVAIPVALTLVWFVVRDVAGLPLHLGSTDGAGRFMAAFAVLAFAAFVAVHAFWRRIVPAEALAAGALLWWLVAVVLTTGVWLPAVSNSLAVWPLAGGVLSLAAVLERDPDRPPSFAALAALAVSSIPSLLLVVPFIATAYVGLQGLLQIGGVVLALAVLTAGLLLPQIDAIVPHHPLRLAALCATAGTVLLAAALLKAHGVAESSVLYVWHPEPGSPRQEAGNWYSFDQRPDRYLRALGLKAGLRQPFEPVFPLIRRSLLAAPAPPLRAPPPTLRLVAVRAAGRWLAADVDLPNPPNSRARALWFEPAGAVKRVRLDDTTVEVGATQGPTIIQQLPLTGPATRLRIFFTGSGPLQIHTLLQIEGLPRLDGLPSRPPEIDPRPLFTLIRSDVTLLRQTLEVPVDRVRAARHSVAGTERVRP